MKIMIGPIICWYVTLGELLTQLSMHDSTLNQNRESASMKQLQLLLAKQEMEFKLALANLKKNKED